MPEHDPGWRHHDREDRRQHREGVVVGGRWRSVGRADRSAGPERTSARWCGRWPEWICRPRLEWVTAGMHQTTSSLAWDSPGRRAFGQRTVSLPLVSTRRSPISEHNLLMISLDNSICRQKSFLLY